MTPSAYGALRGTYNTRALVPRGAGKGDQYAVVRPRLEVEARIAWISRAPGWIYG